MEFRVRPIRFEFRAQGPVVFAPGLAANTFRGALGLLLREVACDAACPGAATCAKAIECAYARAFEPRQFIAGPSGFADLPRPFVLRAAALDGLSYQPGQVFALDLYLFDETPAALFAEALRRLEWAGLGLHRPRVTLERCAELAPVSVPLDTAGEGTRRLTLRFLTPTELKSEGRTLREPRFDVILARARDRVSQLLGIYQGGAPAWDFRGLGERSRAVQVVRHQIQQVGSERRSTRTGQSHSLAGFIGEAEYAGDLAEFLPALAAASWCGVGRHTVWGQGWFVVETMETLATAPA